MSLVIPVRSQQDVGKMTAFDRLGKVTLQIPLEIWTQMTAYADSSSPNEVTGIGTVEKIDDATLKVTEIFLPKQTTSPGHCEFKEGELNEIITDLLERDVREAKKLRFRWHSHARCGVFWSPTDEADIDSWEGNWVVNLVMNVRCEYLARLDCFVPFRIRSYPVEIQVICPDDKEKLAQYTQELVQKLEVVKDTSLGGSRKEMLDEFFRPKPNF